MGCGVCKIKIYVLVMFNLADMFTWNSNSAEVLCQCAVIGELQNKGGHVRLWVICVSEHSDDSSMF